MKSVRLATKIVPARFWKRFLAYLIDITIINIAAVIPLQPFLNKFQVGITSILAGNTGEKIAALSMIVAILTLFYFSAMEFKAKQTIGKMILRIYVTSTNKKEITIYQAILRNVTKPFTLLLIIDTLYMLFKRTNQRLFEVFSSTQTVEGVKY